MGKQQGRGDEIIDQEDCLKGGDERRGLRQLDGSERRGDDECDRQGQDDAKRDPALARRGRQRGKEELIAGVCGHPSHTR